MSVDDAEIQQQKVKIMLTESQDWGANFTICMVLCGSNYPMASSP